MATMCLELVAVDAATGKVCPEFGNGGFVSLPDEPIDPEFLSLVGVSAPPVVANGVVASGSFIEVRTNNNCGFNGFKPRLFLASI